MNSKDLNLVVENTIRDIRHTLESKAREYATDENRLHNFEDAGSFLKCSRELALLGMATKHIISVRDMVLNAEKGILPSENVVYEKIGDTINYMILLKSSLLEKVLAKEK